MNTTKIELTPLAEEISTITNSFRYNIGMDLHSNNVVVVVRQTVQGHEALSGKIVFSKKFKILTETERLKLRNEIEPYCGATGAITVVESTYNWYWLADMFEEAKWTLRICDPSTVSRANLKYSDDFSDASYLAEMLRVDSIKSYPVMPYEERALRDYCRQRQELVQKRSTEKITLTNLFTNQLSIRISTEALVKDAYKHVEDGGIVNEALLAKYFKHRMIRERVAMHIRTIMHFDVEIDFMDELIKESIKENGTAKILQTIKGCGYVLSTCISVEIGHNLGRFKSYKNFVSYCRLAPTAKLSNGKSKGEGNAKNGNAYLSWALTELANMVVRYNPEAKKFYDKIFRRTQLRVKAIRALAAKLARAIFMTLKTGEVFDVKRCFGV